MNNKNDTRPSRRQLPFSVYVTGTFMLIAVMTALITASVVAIVWNNNRFRLFTEQDIFIALVIAGAVAILLAGGVGIFFASSIVNPIRSISKTADAIKNGNLSARTELSGDDELSLLGETFDEMAESIERDRDLERQLIGDVAHELRTPLMAVQATAEAIEDGIFPADDEHLQTLSTETRRLGRLVEELLHLNRLENGTIEPQMALVDLSEMIDSLAIANEAYVESADLTLDADIEVGISVMGDQDLLHQAVTNLLSNAVRYTPAGGHIKISLSHAGGYAIISVTDDGIGIAEDDLKLVFSRFWRADRARTYTEGGLGIGLAQAKAVVDQHEGRIGVTSVLGQGSTFSIYLPLHEQPQKSAHGRNILRRNSKQTKQEAQRARKHRERRLPWQR